ncbi:MAG: cell division protein FtsZ [Marinifilaceae bacterium]
MDLNDEMVSINIPTQEQSIIKVIGVGGGGSNAVNHMYQKGIAGVEFVVCNTDIQALRESEVKNRIQLGKKLTEGLGAGCRPERGKESVLESMEYISTLLSTNTKMVFITAGMGGGTGTGAAPEIAKKAREMGILTVGIVTLPFSFEGTKKIQQAMDGIDELEEYVDALLIIDNEKLRDIYGDLRLSEAFSKADDVLAIAAKSIAEIITVKGHVNVDFADVESVMRDSGVALMGAGEASGEERALRALERALVSPLLKSQNIKGASDVLINILYENTEVSMEEVDWVTQKVQDMVGDDVNIIWGVGKDDNLGDSLRVAIIATGFAEISSKTRVASATKEEKQEKQETLSWTQKKTFQSDFKIERAPEDLRMHLEDSSALEKKAREERLMREEEERRKQEEAQTVRRMRREINRRYVDEEKSRLGVNDLPDKDNWLKNKLNNTTGNLINSLFSDDDPEM